MGASIEWLCPEHGILRAGPEHKSHLTRDPYVFACYVVREGDTALLCGTTDVRRAWPHKSEIHALLVSEGFASVAWERAGKRNVTFPLVMAGSKV